MKREQFPSSIENVDHIVSLGQKGEEIKGPEKKALRDYLAGCVSSNEHGAEVEERIEKIRDILGYHTPQTKASDKELEKNDQVLSKKFPKE